MTPKEKAIELFNKYEKKLMYDYNDYHYKYNAEHCRKCALIAVDEIISQWEYIDTYLSDLGGKLNINLKYWYEVKQEIEKL